MTASELDFGSFLTSRKAVITGDRGGDAYAYSDDLRLLKALREVRAIEFAVGRLVRLGRNVLQGELLGTSVRVGPTQFPRVHAMVERCARTLGIPAPTTFIQGRIDSMNAYTTGTQDASVIVIHSVLLDHMTDDELLFVIGHECGHVQNGHVVYLTAARILATLASQFLPPFAQQPALVGLQTWSRAAEITCDRAGLLCCGDVAVAERSFLKLVTGSRRVYDELNVPVYLDQLREGTSTGDGVGRAAELTKSHPYIPKRIESLKLFARSEVFAKSRGREGGLAMDEVNRQVEQIVRVM